MFNALIPCFGAQFDDAPIICSATMSALHTVDVVDGMYEMFLKVQ